MESRLTMDWCRSKDCTQASLHCRDLEDQYQSYLSLQKRFPDSISVIRYEDLVKSPLDTAKKLISWVGLIWNESVARFVLTHTARNYQSDNPYSLFKSKFAKEKWLSAPWEEVHENQAVCMAAMKYWGYVPVDENMEYVDPLPLDFTL
eukprot:TRINITY_DN51985_c0_g1_i1.p1 TRINITY_DN51985_c0_g1~~TRINITY_DN51985_c0_g1_i1.p1  ORF type:complete len:148 (-),score=14.35 TRINITY_DN51985_c0_g1_i1:53-496(-)